MATAMKPYDDVGALLTVVILHCKHWYFWYFGDTLLNPHFSKSAPRTIAIAGHQHNMHRVGHQAIRPDFDTRPLGSTRQQIEIQRIVTVLEKRPLPPITALCDVVRNARDDNARKTGHQ